MRSVGDERWDSQRNSGNLRGCILHRPVKSFHHHHTMQLLSRESNFSPLVKYFLIKDATVMHHICDLRRFIQLYLWRCVAPWRHPGLSDDIWMRPLHASVVFIYSQHYPYKLQAVARKHPKLDTLIGNYAQKSSGGLPMQSDMYFY